MELELAITSYQRLSPSVTSSHRFGADRSWIIGRADGSDWQLPDPSRVVSSAHAEIRSDGERFLLRDTSTNGVFLNQSVDPVGKGEEVALSDGDRLRIGDYELSVTVRSSLAVAGSGMQVPEIDATPRSGPGTDSDAAPASRSLMGGGLGRLGGSGPVNAGPGVEIGSGRIAGTVADTPLSAPADDRLMTAVAEPAPATHPGAELSAMQRDSSLASGLGERFLGDSHIELPKPAIPDWDWGAAASEEAQPQAASDTLGALLEGLGLDSDQPLTPAQCKALGNLTRTLLDRLLDLLHVRAQQKQELRVKQTLFQRSENNPLKFSATARDALESLLVRPHRSFLGPEQAVTQAFDDVLAHEQALLKGVERVVSDLLAPEPELDRGLGVFGRGRQLEAIRQRRARLQEDYGDIRRMLRSDTFVDAYEQAVSRSERE